VLSFSSDKEAPVLAEDHVCNRHEGEKTRLYLVSRDDDEGVTLDEDNFEMPTFRDNSNEDPVVKANQNWGDELPRGRTDIHVSATDSSGNTANCSWTVYVQSEYSGK
jgi:hypothetical protein